VKSWGRLSGALPHQNAFLGWSGGINKSITSVITTIVPLVLIHVLLTYWLLILIIKD
jgi:hypothetical protein